MTETTSINFQWIASTSSAPFHRVKHRREVMQKLGLRRKEQPKHVRHPNSRQLPLFIPNHAVRLEPKPLLELPIAAQSNESDSVTLWSNNVPPQPSPMNTIYLQPKHSTISAQTNLDYLGLSLLASLEVGRYTGQRLLENPQNLTHFLNGKNWSYFQYIPTNYGSSALIRRASDSVLARVRCLISPGEKRWESLALSSYSRALADLQRAIDESARRPSAEVLCATQVLGLYELLNPARKDAWIKHAAGAACIIKMRGPDSYGSEFEKCLFMSHVGSMITESILNNQQCFLEQPVWRAVLHSVVNNNPLVPDRSAMVNSLLSILVAVPGLFRDITKAICHPPTPSVAALTALISCAQKIRSSLKAWYEEHITTPCDSPILCSGYNRILVLFYICSIYSNRLSTCIYLAGTSGSVELEEESQLFARNIMALYKEEAHKDIQSSLLLAQKVPIAESVIESGEEWKRELGRGGEEGQLFMIPEGTFIRWCTLFGRSTS